jgi:ketol-acid reductoisomerase
VSDTAEHGDYTGGPRIVTAQTRETMRQMLREIQSGDYARAWIAENEKGLPWFTAAREQGRQHQIEEVGARLRGMMAFLDPIEMPRPTAV